MSAHTNTQNAIVDGAMQILNGRWALIEGCIGGVLVPVGALSDLALTISNGTFLLGDTQGVVAIDGRPTPAVMDLMATSGPNRGLFVPGIYECGADVLRICCDLSGVDRPTRFHAAPGTRLFAALYRRATLRRSEG